MHRLLLLVCWLGAATAATTIDLTLEAVRLPDALGELQTITDQEFLADAPLITAAPEVNLGLVAADVRAQRQALAHAAGAWWLDGREPLLTRSDRLPVASNQVRVATHHADLGSLPGAEEVARSLMAPWLDGTVCGIGHDSATSIWSATLSDSGHAQLTALLPLLEQGRPQVPALLPLPAPLPIRHLPEEVQAVSWRLLILALGRTARISVAVGPGVLRLDRQHLASPPVLPAGDLTGACSLLTGSGLYWNFLEDVLCVDVVPPESRRHPALRRLLAVVPVGHLAAPAEVPALIERIRDEVVPDWWQRPGAGLFQLPSQEALVVAADAATMLALMDWLQAREDERETADAH